MQPHAAADTGLLSALRSYEPLGKALKFEVPFVQKLVFAGLAVLALAARIWSLGSPSLAQELWHWFLALQMSFWAAFLWRYNALELSASGVRFWEAWSLEDTTYGLEEIESAYLDGVWRLSKGVTLRFTDGKVARLGRCSGLGVRRLDDLVQRLNEIGVDVVDRRYLSPD